MIRARGVWYRHAGASDWALRDVDLDVEAGEALLLGGPSGGGKSTLVRALCGIVPSLYGGEFSGDVTVGRRSTRDATAAEICRDLGIVLQDAGSHALRANVERDLVAGLAARGVAADRLVATARQSLTSVGASHLGQRAIGTLSGGERQRVAIAAAIAHAPSVMLLDEPTSSLDERGWTGLRAILEAQAALGTAIVVTEHHPERLHGAIGWQRLEVAHGRVGAASPLRAAGAPTLPATGDTVLEARLDGLFRGARRVGEAIEFHVDRGEAVSIRGENGSGKSTLLRSIAGLERTSGTVRVGRRDLTALRADQRFGEVAFVPQGSGRTPLTDRVDRELFYGRRGETTGAAEWLARLDIDVPPSRHPRDLSLGERSRLAIAAALAANPRVLLLDEPTRGLDAERRSTLATVLCEAMRQGSAVVVATHDDDFAHQVCHRQIDLVSASRDDVRTAGTAPC